MKLPNHQLVTSALAALSLVALCTTAQANHAWGGYHWARTANPFMLRLGNNLTPDWSSYLGYIVADWNDPSKAAANNGSSATQYQPWTKGAVIQTVLVTGSAGSKCSAVAGTTQVCNARYGANGWLGLATVWMSGANHIIQGTAKMNDTYFSSSAYNNVNQRRHVICQEVAHSFGLGHQSTNGSSQNSCMDYFSNTGSAATSTKSTRPNYHDFEQLWSMYAGHADSTSTVASTPSQTALRSSVTDDPRTWGRLAHQSANGRHSEYVLKEADGTVAITEVVWTDETAAICRTCDHRSHRPGAVAP